MARCTNRPPTGYIHSVMNHVVPLALLVLPPLTACEAEGGRGPAAGAFDDAGCPDGKCDSATAGPDDGAASCWTPDFEFRTQDVPDSQICGWIDGLDALPADVDAERGLLSTEAGTYASGLRSGTIQWKDGVCAATIANADVSAPGCSADQAYCSCGGYCTITLDVAKMQEVFPSATADDLGDLCKRLTIAHLRCLGERPRDATTDSGLDAEDECDQPDSCHPGLEIGCQRYVPPWTETQPGYPVQQSICTGQTVNGLGFYDHVPHALRVDSCLADDPWDVPDGMSNAAPCTFLGQDLQADRGFCQTLDECVEPRLAQLLGYGASVTGGRDAVYDFPSGRFGLTLDNTCSGGGNHAPGTCRAIDINVVRNGGNLLGGNPFDPEVNIPPAFVAIMEECGLVWGGRYLAALQSDQTSGEPTWGLCDPMHFDYAPCCVSEPADRERLFGPDTRCG